MVKKIPLIICFTVIMCKCVISGTITDGPATIIHGSSAAFTGTDIVGATDVDTSPLKWDTFTGGTVGQSVTTTGYWSKRAAAQANFNNDTLRNNKATQNIKLTHINASPAGWFYKNDIGFTSTGKAYINFWICADYIAGPTEPLWQLKLWRINSDGDNYGSRPILGATATIEGDTPLTEFNRFVSGTGPGGAAWGVDPYYYYSTPNLQWVNVSIAWENGTSGIADGNITVYTSNVPDGNIKIALFENVETADVGEFMNSLSLGYLMENGGESSLSYFDNVYLDNTFERAEIGDAPTYDACENREIQIPESNIKDKTAGVDERTFTVNQGSLADGAAYLYFVNADGTVSAGYAITFGAASTGGSPATLDTGSVINVTTGSPATIYPN